MYVCVCHGISDREIRQRCSEEKSSVAGIYRACGVAPKCGKCVSTVRALLIEAQGAAAEVAMTAVPADDCQLEVAFAEAS